MSDSVSNFNESESVEPIQIVETPNTSLLAPVLAPGFSPVFASGLAPAEVTPFAKAKAVSGERWGRIRTILTAAAKATLTEAKAGATDVQALVTETLVAPQAQMLGTRAQQVWQRLRSQGRQRFQQVQQTYEQVQQRQTAFETQLETNIGKLGTTVASKEQQIKYRVKQFLVKTAEKL